MTTMQDTCKQDVLDVKDELSCNAQRSAAVPIDINFAMFLVVDLSVVVVRYLLLDKGESI